MRHFLHVGLTVFNPKWNPKDESLRDLLNRHWDAHEARDHWRTARPWLAVPLGVAGLLIF